MSANVLATATAGHATAPAAWLTPSRLMPLVDKNPAAVGLALHGAAWGLARDERSPFTELIMHLGRAFEEAWRTHEAPDAPVVCASHRDARTCDALERTIALMARGEPVIASPALWWAPEGIYGIPDLLIRSDQLGRLFPELDPGEVVAPGLLPHYVVADLKFASNLDAKERARYGMQVRLYSYILGQLQGVMPSAGLLITRDGLQAPVVVPVTAEVGGPLEADIAGWCAQYRWIREHGATLRPWSDPAVELNLAADDDEWRTAYAAITARLFPDGNPLNVPEIGPGRWKGLVEKGIRSLPELYARRHELEGLKVQLGAKRAPRVRAVLEANVDGVEQAPPDHVVPALAPYELYIDFEFLSNLRVDFDCQWPTLTGCPMVFMIGIAWEGPGGWEFRRFVAPEESPAGERQVFAELLAFLDGHVGGLAANAERVRLYHWADAEQDQIAGALARGTLQGMDLRPLLCDLLEVMHGHNCAVPGAWDYSLKSVAKALGRHYPELNPAWPEGLGDGLNAMVLGWRAYEHPDPLTSAEMAILTAYLEADCRALRSVLRWMRAEVVALA